MESMRDILFRRWYDQEKTCRKLLEQVKAMPQAETREFCARVMINIGEKIRKELQKQGADNLKVSSIGVSALSGLYQYGQRKHRWYDKSPALHKAAGLFYTLPPEGLAILGFKLGDTFGLLQIYATVCDQVDQAPSTKAMAEICTTAMRAGKKEAEEILVAIVGKDLYQSISHTVDLDA